MSPAFVPANQFFLTNLAADSFALGYAIDNQGRVAGVLSTSNGSGTRFEGFVWAGGDLQTFGPLTPGDPLQVKAMNNHGEVVGDSGARAFVWVSDWFLRMWKSSTLTSAMPSMSSYQSAAR